MIDRTRHIFKIILIMSLMAGCGLLPTPKETTQTPVQIQATPISTQEQVIVQTNTPSDDNVTPPERPTPPMIDASSVASLAENSRILFDNPTAGAWNLTNGSFSIYSSDALRSFSFESNAELSTVQLNQSAQLLDISPDGSLSALTSDMMTVQIIDLLSSQVVNTLDPQTMVNTAHFSPDGQRLLITSMDEAVASEYDLATSTLLDSYSGFSFAGPVYNVIYARYTDDILWYSRGSVMIQNLKNHEVSTTLYHEDFINSLSLSPDGKMLAVATAKTQGDTYGAGIQLWDTTTGTDMGFISTQGMDKDLTFTHDGLLLIGADVNQLCVWNPITLNLVQSFSGHTDTISFVSLSPDSTRILTGSFDNTVILWTILP